MQQNALRFLIPSLLGVLIFLIPISWNGNLTIGIGIITGWVNALLGEQALGTVIILMVLTSCLTLLGSVTKVPWIHNQEWLKELFAVSHIWMYLRLAGTAFGLVYFFQIGPELLKSEEIGGAVYVGIAINVLCVYIAACLLLPLLTDFGFMEFVGTLASPLFRRLFHLPGHAAIDAVASVVGASSIGLLITIKQFEHGNYSSREACVIATNFSIVSIPFSLVVAKVAGIEEYFLPWYGCVLVVCLIAAMITPRLPPLAGKLDTQGLRESTSSKNLLAQAWNNSMSRAQSAPNVAEFFRGGFSNLLFFTFSVITPTMALATIAAVLTLHTPLFEWLGYPLVGLLEFTGLTNAVDAAPGLFSGFLDQFMPALIAGEIESQSTSFVLAGLSVCQLVFMSEVGVIILRSSLPLGVGELAIIFLLRTLIALPILILGANLLVS